MRLPHPASKNGAVGAGLGRPPYANAQSGHCVAPAALRPAGVKVVVALLVNNLELLDPLATVFSNVDIAFGVHRDPVRLVELPREVPDAAETRQDLAGLTIQNFDFGI